MIFKILFTELAESQFNTLKNSPSLEKRFKAVRKTIGIMEINLKHPSLNTHKFTSLKTSNGADVFESYAENNTAGAYRIFWYYGPDKKQITILAITPHP